ncbi:chromosome partitioning protein ParA [Nonomuraea longicatena]|uniref:chromosome partitioning protein ParA n=1 Tax=Nonomuraea longicatena TaxID=83682 RepID=UPI0031DA91FD
MSQVENVVGDRVLIAMQAVNISRLSTHPVPTVPGTLIVVAGAGPKDSNGAGKSSFIASITALLGDEQWRFASGAKAVSELLFNAELASGAGAKQWASADHGYIVGVFGPPGADESVFTKPAGADGSMSSGPPEPGAVSSGPHEPGDDDELGAGPAGTDAADRSHAETAGRSDTADRSHAATAGRSATETPHGSGPRTTGRSGAEVAAGPGGGGELFELPDTSGGALTVWLRVNQEAPHLEIRWREGVHLAAAASEAERVARADDLWASLPRSAGRRDVVARDLTKVLYGDRVRCVSFLSTSVRSKVATNLLSQPLNEISPERVFEAIAALTGLDTELEQEREARRDEHARRVKAVLASERLAEFESESKALVTTFDRRDEARVRLAESLRCWRGRQARKLADAADRDEALAADSARHRRAGEAAAEEIARVQAEIATLKDDTLDRRVGEARKELAALQARAAKLESDRAVAANSADELRRRIPGLEEERRFADGRDVPAAEGESRTARLRLNEALKALGVADQEAASAQAALDDAEGGPAAAQLNTLTAAGVEATGLLDALDVAEQARDDNSAQALTGLRGWPHEHAVIVDAARLDAAAAALADLPGSVLVSAAGVSVVGAFDGVATGREARIKAAEHRLHRAKDGQETAAQAVRQAEEDVAQAQRRLEGAKAAVRLAEVEERLAERRERLAELSAALEEAAPKVAEAERQAGALDFRARTRDMEIERLEGRRQRLEAERGQAAVQDRKVGAERDSLKLEALAADWGGSVEGAREWVAALPEEERPRGADEWWRLAERGFDHAYRDTFPEADAEVPEELRFLMSERAGSSAREQATFAAVCGALASYLRGQEEYEKHQRRQIEAQLVSRQRDLAAADKGAEEAARSTAVHRAALTAAIKARLARVAEEFEKLDTGYGGYGATLEFPVPPPPADPEQRWQWRVTPKWRRGDGQGFVPYNRRANTALMDEKAVKLVCAAAIASSGGGHLCLVLDELGRNLGKEHRREAVALFRRIGETYGITVIGALQDDMEPYAIDACGQYIKLRRSSDAMPYNEPPVIVGHDEHAARVRALAAYVER